MIKPDNTKRIEKFRQDARLLQSKYSQKEIAEKLKIGNANFNGYYNGHKTPGKRFLNKFDHLFSEEIKELTINYLDYDKQETCGQQFSLFANRAQCQWAEKFECLESILECTISEYSGAYSDS